MAHFAYIGGSLGAWATGTTITAAKLWQLDQNQYAAINGDGGGTWSPTAKIVIGGANGLELSSSPLLLSGTSSLTVGGAASFTGAFSATGTSLTLGNNSTSTLSLRAITTVTKLIVCQDAFVAQGNVTIGLSSAQTFTVNSTETHNADETHNGIVALKGNSWVGDSGAVGTKTFDSYSVSRFHSKHICEGVESHSYATPSDGDYTASDYKRYFLFQTVTSARVFTEDFVDELTPGAVFTICNNGSANISVNSVTYGSRGTITAGSNKTFLYTGSDLVFLY